LSPIALNDTLANGIFALPVVPTIMKREMNTSEPSKIETWLNTGQRAQADAWW
jgi:hypothetical protein